jgi:sugar lactone lactonase YvrE
MLAELSGLEIHAIVLDSQDRVYAATSPDGRVYRVTAAGAVEEYYDPKAKYIWALALNSKGELFVATGDQGEVHRVTAPRTGSIFYRTEEAHARSLIVDPQGNVVVGTEPGGLVLRVSPAGQGFVLYQTSKREVTALAADSKGGIYAAAVGTRTASSAPSPNVTPAPAPPPTSVSASGGAAVSVAPRPSAPPPPSAAGTSVSGGAEVVYIEPDGYPRKVWSDDKDIAYALAFDKEGRLMIATGNQGKLYRLDSPSLSSIVVSAAPTQITGLAAGRGGRVLAVTGNIGKLYRLGPEIEKQGTYEGEALDAGFFTYWGRMNYTADLNGGSVKLETRSGNLDSPQRAWSPWAPVPLNSTFGRVASPAARFLQYRLTLTAASDGKTPALGGVDIAYQQKNVAPVIEIIDLTPPNYRFPVSTIALAASTSQTISLNALGRSSRNVSTVLSGNDAPATSMNFAKGYLGARWLARDENGDPLLSKVDIRGDKESVWKTLKDETRDRNLSFDSTAFPDGDYRLRVTVADAPGNAPAQALSSSLESDVFTIDNTPPRLVGLAGTRSGAKVEVKWKAADALSVISKAEYSVNGGDWKSVEPTTRLTDSAEHDYVLTLDGQSAGETTVAVRVSDYYDNQVVDKVVVR